MRDVADTPNKAFTQMFDDYQRNTIVGYHFLFIEIFSSFVLSFLCTRAKTFQLVYSTIKNVCQELLFLPFFDRLRDNDGTVS